MTGTPRDVELAPAVHSPTEAPAGATQPPTRARSTVERVVDTLTTTVFRLPPQRNDYTVTQGIRVPMRDGTHLLTDHYAPTTPPVGTILMRGPYRRFGALPHVMLGLWASRGYHVVMQSFRGTFGSEGTFEPVGTRYPTALTLWRGCANSLGTAASSSPSVAPT